jgi:hypothetical protein
MFLVVHVSTHSLTVSRRSVTRLAGKADKTGFHRNYALAFHPQIMDCPDV